MKTRYPIGFEIAVASVCGGCHRRLSRGNQDAASIESTDEAIVAVVADGCGSAADSGVGAAIGARLWARALATEIEATESVRLEIIERARDAVTARLRELVAALAGEPAETVAELFLFTTIGAVVGSEATLVFAIGDGLVGVNGSWIRLGPFPGNCPPYLGYDLLPDRPAPAPLTLVAALPTRAVDSIIISTDGAEPLVDRELAELCASDLPFARADALRRQLEPLARARLDIDWDRERVNRPPALLSDDTTVVAIRRRASSAATAREAS